MTAEAAILAGGESLSTKTSIPLRSLGGRRCCGGGGGGGGASEEEQRGTETLKRRRWVRKGEGGGSRREGWVWEGVRVEGFMVPCETTSLDRFRVCRV